MVELMYSDRAAVAGPSRSVYNRQEWAEDRCGSLQKDHNQDNCLAPGSRRHPI